MLRSYIQTDVCTDVLTFIPNLTFLVYVSACGRISKQFMEFSSISPTNYSLLNMAASDLQILELKPDRSMLDSSFDGYKLTLTELPTLTCKLDNKIDQSHLTSKQYSFLHAKLFGLHNYLFADPHESKETVYFVDKELNVFRTHVDSLIHELVTPIKVWTVPKVRERLSGDYNISLCFASSNIVTISDGLGTLYILDKTIENNFSLLYSGEVIGKHDQGFIIFDAKYKQELRKLQVLLIHIEEDDKDRFVSIIHCITFKNDESWNQTSLKQLKTKGEVQYLYLGEDLDSLNIVTNNELEFTLDSDNSAEIKDPVDTSQVKKVYRWSQTAEEINIKINLPENADKNLLKVNISTKKLEVMYGDESVLSGDFTSSIDQSLTTWEVNKDGILEVNLTKPEGSMFWPELIIGNQQGEYLLDPSIVESVKERLGNLTSDRETLPPAGTTFNSAEVEECDFESDKTSTFERIQISTCKRTHKIRLGSHGVLLTTKITPHLSPAMGLRSDVDICLWQPKMGNGGFEVEHVGTLLAIGYVQASKQNRKFTVASPDLSYCAISESTGHIFIYKQNHPLNATHLRNRTSGQRIKTLAQQQVVNLANQQILGIYAGEKNLFLLGEDLLTALKINE